MAIEWYRVYHGTPFDPKFAGVAARVGAQVCEVFTCWMCVLDYTSQQEERGSVAGLDIWDAACALGIDPPMAERIIEQFRQRGMIADTGVASWAKRQFVAEDRTATERQRRKRERDREKRDATEDHEAVTDCHASVTPCHGPDSDSDSDSDIETESSSSSSADSETTMTPDDIEIVRHELSAHSRRLVDTEIAEQVLKNLGGDIRVFREYLRDAPTPKESPGLYPVDSKRKAGLVRGRLAEREVEDQKRAERDRKRAEDEQRKPAQQAEWDGVVKEARDDTGYRGQDALMVRGGDRYRSLLRQFNSGDSETRDAALADLRALVKRIQERTYRDAA